MPSVSLSNPLDGRFLGYGKMDTDQRGLYNVQSWNHWPPGTGELIVL